MFIWSHFLARVSSAKMTACYMVNCADPEILHLSGTYWIRKEKKQHSTKFHHI